MDKSNPSMAGAAISLWLMAVIISIPVGLTSFAIRYGWLYAEAMFR